MRTIGLKEIIQHKKGKIDLDLVANKDFYPSKLFTFFNLALKLEVCQCE